MQLTDTAAGLGQQECGGEAEEQDRISEDRAGSVWRNRRGDGRDRSR